MSLARGTTDGDFLYLTNVIVILVVHLVQTTGLVDISHSIGSGNYHKFLKNCLALATCVGYQFITIFHTTGQLERFSDGHFCSSDIFGNKAAKFGTTVVYDLRRNYSKGQKGLVSF